MKILFLEIDTESVWGLAATGPDYFASYIRQAEHEAASPRVKLDTYKDDLINAAT